MKKKILTLLLLISIQAFSQTGINTKNPDPSSVLDVVSTDKGVLIPRMTTLQRTAIATPAHSLLVYDTDKKVIMQNIGDTATPNWVPLTMQDPRKSFFYMPSVSIDASEVATNKTLDLYDVYKRQFSATDPTTFKASQNAPTTIPYFPNRTDLHYYITLFDNTIIQINSLDANGVLNYNILRESDYDSFMNVVFTLNEQ